MNRQIRVGDSKYGAFDKKSLADSLVVVVVDLCVKKWGQTKLLDPTRESWVSGQLNSQLHVRVFAVYAGGSRERVKGCL